MESPQATRGDSNASETTVPGPTGEPIVSMPLKTASLLALVGIAWMGVILVLNSVPGGRDWIVRQRGPLAILLKLAEFIAGGGLLLFFFVLRAKYQTGKDSRAVPIPVSLAVLSTEWMLVVAFMHRMPDLWRGFALLGDGILLATLQTASFGCLLVFFIWYTRSFHGETPAARGLRAAGLVAAVGTGLITLESLLHVFPFLQGLLSHSRPRILGRLFILGLLVFFAVVLTKGEKAVPESGDTG